MFEHLVESAAIREAKGKSPLLVSLVLHSILLVLLAATPLIYYSDLPSLKLLTMLAAPPPPPPPPTPPPAPIKVQEVHVVSLDLRNLMEIPKQIPAPGEVNPEISALTGITVGLPEAPDWAFTGGIPGGVEAGVPGGIVFQDLPALPIPVGGKLQNSKLIHKVQPQYPEAARLAGVEGIVLLQVLVSQDGLVSDIEILRGHPLLNEAAINAVRQWRYSPTLLNGSSIPTIATVTVNFVLQSPPAQESS